MKRYLLLLQALALSLVLSSQATMPTRDEIKQFMASRTCGVLEDDALSAYNQYIKDAVRKFWDLTPFEFIDGREFNLSILPEHGKPCLLPIAEMLFIDYPADKPRITGYEAKWEEQSWAFNHTRRTFEKQPSDEALHARLAEIALRCWEVFGGKGYARVDLRVDPAGQPYVLEVNLNPCIAQDSGFVAAAAQAGLSYRDMVERIIKG